MKKYYYIIAGGAKWPITFTISTFLLMERFHAPEWLWGIYIFCLVLIWFIAAYFVFNAEKVDLLDPTDSRTVQQIIDEVKRKKLAKKK